MPSYFFVGAVVDNRSVSSKIVDANFYLVEGETQYEAFDKLHRIMRSNLGSEENRSMVGLTRVLAAEYDNSMLKAGLWTKAEGAKMGNWLMRQEWVDER